MEADVVGAFAEYYETVYIGVKLSNTFYYYKVDMLWVPVGGWAVWALALTGCDWLLAPAPVARPQSPASAGCPVPTVSSCNNPAPTQLLNIPHIQDNKEATSATVNMETTWKQMWFLSKSNIYLSSIFYQLPCQLPITSIEIWKCWHLKISHKTLDIKNLPQHRHETKHGWKLVEKFHLYPHTDTFIIQKQKKCFVTTCCWKDVVRFVRPCIILVWEPGPVIEESGVPFYFYQETQDFQLDTPVHIFIKFFFP